MRIVLTGASGRLAGRLADVLAGRGHDVIGLTRTQLDITHYAQAVAAITRHAPDLVIHPAGLTHVDRCAEQPDEALRVNGYGTHNLALACAQSGAALAYLSTNEVFAGDRAAPYLEYDAPRPPNPYGYSKWVGEQAVRDLLPRHYVIRTSWLFAHGGDNFLQKLIGLAAQGRSLHVVTDEIGAPTYADDLAESVAALIETGRFGVYHLVNDGSASRYAFARHILDCAGYADVPIQPISSAQRPRPSRPPTYSTLRNFAAAQLGITLRPWRDAVNAYFERERMAVPTLTVHERR